MNKLQRLEKATLLFDSFKKMHDDLIAKDLNSPFLFFFHATRNALILISNEKQNREVFLDLQEYGYNAENKIELSEATFLNQIWKRNNLNINIPDYSWYAHLNQGESYICEFQINNLAFKEKDIEPQWEQSTLVQRCHEEAKQQLELNLRRTDEKTNKRCKRGSLSKYVEENMIAFWKKGLFSEKEISKNFTRDWMSKLKDETYYTLHVNDFPNYCALLFKEHNLLDFPLEKIKRNIADQLRKTNNFEYQRYFKKETREGFAKGYLVLEKAEDSKTLVKGGLGDD